MSCGVLELSRIGDDFHKVLYSLASRLYHPSRGAPAAFVCWSTTNTDLWKFIYEMFDGQGLSATDMVENPKTSNDIAIFTWAIPHERLKTWYKEFKIAKIKKE